jgi:hypothetical protein
MGMLFVHMLFLLAVKGLMCAALPRSLPDQASHQVCLPSEFDLSYAVFPPNTRQTLARTFAAARQGHQLELGWLGRDEGGVAWEMKS